MLGEVTRGSIEMPRASVWHCCRMTSMNLPLDIGSIGITYRRQLQSTPSQATRSRAGGKDRSFHVWLEPSQCLCMAGRHSSDA